MAEDGYATVFQTTDAAQGGLVAEMLRGEGIDARFHSVSSALIGLHAGLIEMAVTVPVGSAARARELLAELEYVGAAEAVERGPDDDADDDGEAPGAASRSRWRALTRAGFTFFLPGTVHFYAGRPWTALALAVSAGWCVVGAVEAPSGSVTFGAFVATVFAIVLGDMVHGVSVATAEIRGEHLAPNRQVLEGLGLAFIALLLGLGISLAVSVPGLWRAHVIQRFHLTCTKSQIIIESADGTDRDLSFQRVGVIVPNAADTEGTYRVRLLGPPAMRLRGGATARLPFEVDPKRSAVCARTADCRVVIDVSLAPLEPGPDPLHASGECTPSWGDTSDEAPGSLSPAEAAGE